MINNFNPLQWDRLSAWGFYYFPCSEHGLGPRPTSHIRTSPIMYLTRDDWRQITAGEWKVTYIFKTLLSYNL